MTNTRFVLRTLIALCPLLLTLSCGHKGNNASAAAREREEQRAHSLDSEFPKKFASISEQTRQTRDLLTREEQAVARIVPEYRSYRDQLTSDSNLIDQIGEAVTAKRYNEIARPALDGFKSSSALGMQIVSKMNAGLDEMIKAIDAKKYSSLQQTNGKAQYYKALNLVASVHEGIFLETLRMLALNSPRAERAALFEQATGLYPLIERPGASLGLGQVLQEAYAQEDDAGNRARMEQLLKQLNIPLNREKPNTEQGNEKPN